jgi:hypothetical protein
MTNEPFKSLAGLLLEANRVFSIPIEVQYDIYERKIEGHATGYSYVP